MTRITRTRGQWTAKVAGIGVLPVMRAEDLREDMLVQSWFTNGTTEDNAAQRQRDAVIRQLTAGNPGRKVRAVIAPNEEITGKPECRLFEFTLVKMAVSKLRGGRIAYNYLLTNGQELAA